MVQQCCADACHVLSLRLSVPESWRIPVQVNLKRKHFVPEATNSRASSRCTAIFQQQMAAAAQAAGDSAQQQRMRQKPQGLQQRRRKAVHAPAGTQSANGDSAGKMGRGGKGFKALHAKQEAKKRSAVQVRSVHAISGALNVYTHEFCPERVDKQQNRPHLSAALSCGC